MRSRSISCALILSTLLGIGCSHHPPQANRDGGRLRIVATTGMVADLCRHVAGEQADVVALMASGVDPHLYKPTTRDIAEIMDADLVFYNGLMLEGPMQPTFEKAAARGKRIIPVGAVLSAEQIRHPSMFEGHPDPHVWMNVRLWMACLEPVIKTLSEADPQHAAEFEANAARYREELQKLDAYVTEVIASIPEARRTLVTAHDAFGYFSEAYHIPVRSVQGITTESEPGVEDVNALVSFLADNKIAAVFVETSVSDRNLMAVLEGVRQRNVPITIGGRLYSDAMGPDGSYEGTYVGMIDHNATVIARSLGGSAPELGFQGKLTATTVAQSERQSIRP